MAINECKAWINSADHFLNSLQREYIAYADIITPIVYAVTQVREAAYIFTYF